MTSVTGRAGATIAHWVEVVDGRLESRGATVTAGAFGKSRLVSIHVVNGPMVPFACGRIRIVTEKDETTGRCRGGLPVEGWRKIFSITGEAARDRCAVREGT